MYRTSTPSHPLNSFGSIMEGRSYEGDTSLRYRFGFNGKEKDNEPYGDGNEMDFGARMYDSRIGRWLSLDPLMAKYPFLSPFNYCENNPVVFIDPDGKDAIITINAKDKTITISTTIYLKGKGATNEVSATMQADIMQDWNIGAKYTDKDGNEFAVKFDVNVKVKERGDRLKSGDNIVRVKNNVSRSYSGGNKGTWRGKGTDGNDLRKDSDPAPHEFGHFIGLKDRYDRKTSDAHVGWIGNVMAMPAGQGKVDTRNIFAVLDNELGDKTLKVMKTYNKELKKHNGDESKVDKKKTTLSMKVEGGARN
jgi:RHS repeat-associated protein